MTTYYKVYIIILNYNGWQDTIECLETVLRNNYPNYQVVVVDNNSPNNSMEYIKAWAEGKLDVWMHPNHPLKDLSRPPIKKPVPYVFYSKEEAEQGGNPELESKLKDKIPEDITTKEPLIFIQSGKNRGFSAGNNIGIKYALKKDDFEYIWLLNNDTVIRKDSLSKLIECVKSLDENTSPVGTVLAYYDLPDKIQALGGKFNKFYALGRHLFVLKSIEEAIKEYKEKKVKIDHVIGASMLLNKKFLKEVGLLDEDYFIYFEEIDLCERGRKKGFKPYICLNSIVYHKEAVTMNEVVGTEFSDFFAMRNRIIFTKKNNPFYLPFVYLSFIVSIIKRLKRREYKKAYNIIKIILGKRNYE